jgi:hypothetical protein
MDGVIQVPLMIKQVVHIVFLKENVLVQHTTVNYQQNYLKFPVMAVRESSHGTIFGCPTEDVQKSTDVDWPY